ncbi:MAG: serine/threonine protein kinase [Deltaproteobacteria bacterium]|nr:serine/threonine protein kinase [Deltaproteobacteria bacterium]
MKVLDFGIAKVANGPKRLTRDGEVLGTPHYMSPEQCEGDGVDHRTDIYALGVLLYEMLTGHVPHDADTMMGILTKQMYEDPIPPKVRVPQISEPLEQLIMRCLEKKPEQRYQTMHDIEADLQRIHTGKQPVGPDTVTLKPTRPPAPTHRAVSPIYLGGLAMALLALVGTLAADAYTRPMADVDTASQTGNFAAPPGLEPDAEQPAAAASSDPEVETKAPRAKRLRRHSRHRPKSSPQRDQAILDPWK